MDNPQLFSSTDFSTFLLFFIILVTLSSINFIRFGRSGESILQYAGEACRRRSSLVFLRTDCSVCYPVPVQSVSSGRASWKNKCPHSSNHTYTLWTRVYLQ